MSNTVIKAGVDHIGVSIAFCCHDGNGKFLLHKRSQTVRDEQGCWEFGGGKLEFGEEILDGVRRELMEEYGCIGTVNEVLQPRNLLREHNGVKTHWINFAHILEINPHEAKINEPESMVEIGWFTLDNLPEPLHSGVQPIIELCKEQFAKYS